MIKRAVLFGFASGLLAITSARPAAAQDFKWQGELTAGSLVEVHGIYGRIEAVPAAGKQVVVTAEKHEGKDGSPEDVTFDVVEHDGDVTICTRYPSRPGRRTTRCEPGDVHLASDNNDTQIDFHIEVPAGVNLLVATVNGDVVVRRISGDLDASAVNGDVDVEVGGNVEASTINGSIQATMHSPPRAELRFSTVNGNLTVALPEGSSADVEARTVNGSLESELPLAIKGRVTRRRIRGEIGTGGPLLLLETVNGEISLRGTS